MKKRALLIVLALTCTLAFGLLGSGCVGANKPIMDAKIVNSFTVGDYDGSTLLVVEAEVTNNSDVNLYAGMLQTFTTATLNGDRLSEGYLSSDNPHAIDLLSNITPGQTEVVQLVYKLTATEGTIELVSNVDTVDYKGTVEVLNDTIDLADVESRVSESDFDVVIDDVVITDDGEGKDLAVLYVTFTNNSDEAASYGSAISTELFQNDIALKTSNLPYNHPARDGDLSSNAYTDIKKGASIELILVFELNDASEPVEIKCIDSRSYDKAVIIDKTIELSGTPSSQNDKDESDKDESDKDESGKDESDKTTSDKTANDNKENDKKESDKA